MKTFKLLLPSLALLVLTGGFAAAQGTITVDPADPETFNATSVDPFYGYDLYDSRPASTLVTQTEYNFLPSFVTSETFDSLTDGSPNDYAQNATALTVNGTAYQLGELNNGQNNEPAPGMSLLLTLTLGGDIPASFELGEITNDQGTTGNGSNTAITVTLDNSSGTQLGTTGMQGTSTGTSTSQNDIYNDVVTGAVAGDTLNFYVTSSSYTALAGVTFDTPLSVPEPTTWAFLLSSVGFLGFVVFRRRQQA